MKIEETKKPMQEAFGVLSIYVGFTVIMLLKALVVVYSDEQEGLCCEV